MANGTMVRENSCFLGRARARREASSVSEEAPWELKQEGLLGQCGHTPRAPRCRCEGTDVELSVCSRRGGERESFRCFDILERGWLCSVLGKRRCFISTSSADAATSSKQSVQKAGRGLHVLAA